MRKNNLRRAFTLSEVLVTLAVIGVIAAITMGILTSRTSTLEQNVAHAKLMDSVSTALATMQLDNKLTGYSNTQKFAEQFKNYYDVKSELSGDAKTKFIDTGVNQGAIAVGADADAPDVNDYYVFKDSNNATIAFTYNVDKCAVTSRFTKSGTKADRATDSISFRNSALECLTGFYDVNGEVKGPNKLGKDMDSFAPYTSEDLECEGNKIPTSDGECICPITSSECASSGQTLDKENCKCVCDVKCPLGKKLNEDTCKCECELSEESCDTTYSRFDPTSCTCKVDLVTPIKCMNNGGTWNSEKGTCVCKSAEEEGSCEQQYNGYATADAKDFCECKCKTPDAIKKQIQANAVGESEAAMIVKYTSPYVASGTGTPEAIEQEKLKNMCVSCSTVEDGMPFTMKKDDKTGLCYTESKNKKEDCPDDGVFFKWQGYNAANPANSYYCKCVLQQSTCNTAYRDAYIEKFGFEPKKNYCIADDNYYSNYVEGACKSHIDACIADPKSAACLNTVTACIIDPAEDDYCMNTKNKTCKGDAAAQTLAAATCKEYVQECKDNPTSAKCLETPKKCNLKTNVASSTPRYSCTLAHRGVNSTWVDIKNGSLVAEVPTGNADVNTCYCKPAHGTDTTPSNISYALHGAKGIAESSRFSDFPSYDLTVSKGATYGDKPVTVKKALIYEKYTSSWDPIVFNVDAANPYAEPEATSNKDIYFKDEQNETFQTAWLKLQTKPEFYFLVNDKNGNGQVDNIDELYNDLAGNFTGLVMLQNEFKDISGAAPSTISYPALANKGLKAWADMTHTEGTVSKKEAKVHSGESLIDLLKLTASMIVEEEIIEPEEAEEVVAQPAPETDENVSQVEEAQQSENETTKSQEEVVAQPAPETDENVSQVEEAQQSENETTKSQEEEVVVKKEPIIKRTERLAFTGYSGLGIFDINAIPYIVSAAEDGTPIKVKNANIAIQSRYTIFKKLDKVSNDSELKSKYPDKYWIEIVPVAAGANPDIEYIDTNDNSVLRRDIVTDGSNWEDKFYNGIKDTYILPGANKSFGIFLKIEDSSGKLTYYELTVRGLTDIIFEKP